MNQAAVAQLSLMQMYLLQQHTSLISFWYTWCQDKTGTILYPSLVTNIAGCIILQAVKPTLDLVFMAGAILQYVIVLWQSGRVLLHKIYFESMETVLILRKGILDMLFQFTQHGASYVALYQPDMWKAMKKSFIIYIVCSSSQTT